MENWFWHQVTFSEYSFDCEIVQARYPAILPKIEYTWFNPVTFASTWTKTVRSPVWKWLNRRTHEFSWVGSLLLIRIPSFSTGNGDDFSKDHAWTSKQVPPLRFFPEKLSNFARLFGSIPEDTLAFSLFVTLLHKCLHFFLVGPESTPGLLNRLTLGIS